MRIHTDLTSTQLYDAVKRDSGAPIAFRKLDEHGSATHAHAFEVRFEGSGGRNNTGLYGAGDYIGATWDEWGAALGAIFALDPGARAGGTARRPIYGNAHHFHFLTAGRFQRYEAAPTVWSCMPANTHPRHGWVYDGISAGGAYHVHRCRTCGTISRRCDFETFMSAVDDLIGA